MERKSSQPKVVGSSPTVGKDFHFVILAFLAYLTAWQSDNERNQALHTPKQYLVFARKYVFAGSL